MEAPTNHQRESCHVTLTSRSSERPHYLTITTWANLTRYQCPWTVAKRGRH